RRQRTPPFPTRRSSDLYVDGGIYAANPALCATLLTQDERLEIEGERPSLDELEVFSVGTGLAALHVGAEAREWGLAQWARPLLGLMLDGGVEMTDHYCRLLLRERYHRLNPWIEGEPIRLDDVEAFNRLGEAAGAVDLAPTLAWLDATRPGARS